MTAAQHEPAAQQTSSALKSPVAQGAPAAHRPPVALSIAGTDPSGGAGIHADLKAFTALGAYGTTVITALVAQNTHGVSRVYPVDTDFVADQYDAVLDDITIDATKTGMLGTRALVELAVDRAGRGDLGFFTVDPVMVATSGHRLLEQDAVGAVRDLLAPVADLKAFTALGAYGTTVITALVAQNTHGVSRVYPVDTDFVSDQYDAVLDDITVDATKTGMLGTRALVELAVDRAGRGDLGFFTVDPVMVATSGHRLLEQDAVGAVRDLLAPVADLITPNLPEAALLLGDDVPAARDLDEQRAQAIELVRRGSRAVLLKGGHGLGDVLVDVLAVDTPQGVELREFRHPRIATPHTHGTGCTLSAAITAEAATALRAGRHLDSPDALAEVVAPSLDYLGRAIASGADWQLSRTPDGSHGPVDHLVDLTGDAR